MLLLWHVRIVVDLSMVVVDEVVVMVYSAAHVVVVVDHPILVAAAAATVAALHHPAGRGGDAAAVGRRLPIRAVVRTEPGVVVLAIYRPYHILSSSNNNTVDL
jgi:hypothetical protein